MSTEDEADEIREQIEDLDTLLEVLKLTLETLALLRPSLPAKETTH